MSRFAVRPSRRPNPSRQTANQRHRATRSTPISGREIGASSGRRLHDLGWSRSVVQQAGRDYSVLFSREQLVLCPLRGSPSQLLLAAHALLACRTTFGSTTFVASPRRIRMTITQ